MNETGVYDFKLEYTFAGNAEVTEKVAKFIPTVKVREITWDTGGQGNLIAKVVITSA